MSEKMPYKRVWYRGKVSTPARGVGLPKNMIKAIEYVSKKEGYSYPELIGTVMDRYLQEYDAAHAVDWPEEAKPPKD